MSSPSLLPPTDSTHHVHPSILREYDIRGIVGESLFEADAYAIGRGFATQLYADLKRPPRLCVARDGRLSSPMIFESLVKGLVASGAEVVEVGIGPTPMLYFCVHHLKKDGGIMVTGSHNPPTHNGFKFMQGLSSFYGENIQKLGRLMASGHYLDMQGSRSTQNCIAPYLASLNTGINAAPARTLNVAWDPGNGASGEIVAMLAADLPGTHTTINTVIDGHFPNHHPDPSVEHNMRQLIQTVSAHQCDVGLAFDGDGDRLGVIDDLGRMVSPDHLLMLFARDVLSATKGTIIADVKTSQTFFDDVAAHGGVPLMYKTGHSHIKSKMKEISAPFAGEASGHIFFADRYFGFDDGIYAAMRLINLLQKQSLPLSTLIDRLPSALSTPEIRLACPDDRKFIVIEEIKARLQQQQAQFTDIDGVRVQTADGWWLVRASNTQAIINARCEATEQSKLDRLINALRSQLHDCGIILSLTGDAAGH